MSEKLQLNASKLSDSASLAKGFTLVELLVTIAILAILVTIALPDLRGFMVSSKLSSNTNEFIGLLNYARSEAIARNQNIVVCSQEPNNTCSSDAFWGQRPVQVFVDDNGNRERDASELLLKTIAAQDPSGTQFNLKRESTSQTINFLPVGYVRALGKFQVNAIGDATYETKYGRLICISTAGRVRAAPFTTANCNN